MLAPDVEKVRNFTIERSPHQLVVSWAGHTKLAQGAMVIAVTGAFLLWGSLCGAIHSRFDPQSIAVAGFALVLASLVMFVRARQHLTRIVVQPELLQTLAGFREPLPRVYATETVNIVDFAAYREGGVDYIVAAELENGRYATIARIAGGARDAELVSELLRTWLDPESKYIAREVERARR